MLLNADLHIHSLFSLATSPSMTPQALIHACITKGINALGSGDALHPAWRRMWQEDEDDTAGIIVIPSAEVEDRSRVHHLILAEDFSLFEDLEERLNPHSRDITTGGRPHVALSGEEIARETHEAGGLIGSAHAFTPWTSLYASFSHVRDCYGDEEIDFLELGLSADSAYGAAISELYEVPFLSNSDAHSPTPLKIGREFNRLEVSNPAVREVLTAVTRGDIAMNAGFFPEEGKYNRTACIRCYRQFTLEEAERLNWRCPDDRKRLKKGVSDRARELSDGRPGNRPPYRHIIPLGEIIQRLEGTSSPVTKRCTARYEHLIETLGPEIGILMDIPVNEIRGVDPGVADCVDALRDGKVHLHAGGGGKYGSFDFQVRL